MASRRLKTETVGSQLGSQALVRFTGVRMIESNIGCATIGGVAQVHPGGGPNVPAVPGVAGHQLGGRTS
jgi:hypothetical protein